MDRKSNTSSPSKENSTRSYKEAVKRDNDSWGVQTEVEDEPQEAKKLVNQERNINKTANVIPTNQERNTVNRTGVISRFNRFTPQNNGIQQRSSQERAASRMGQIHVYIKNNLAMKKNIELFANTRTAFNIDMSESDIKCMTDNMLFYIKDYEEFKSKIERFEKQYLPKLDECQAQILWKALKENKIEHSPFNDLDEERFSKVYRRIPSLEDAIQWNGDYYPPEYP